MDKSEAIKKLKQFAEIVIPKFNPEKIILFGSFAKDEQKNNSDIDVAVIVNKVDGDFLDKEAELFRIRRSIDASIEPFLFESGSDKSGFLKDIVKYGNVMYPKPVCSKRK